MRSHQRSVGQPRFTLPFYVLVLLLAVLWFAGGASRADVAGQIVVRSASWTSLIILLLFAPKPSFHDVKPVTVLLAAIVAAVLLQLIPLPPAIWQSLPGREPLLSIGTMVDVRSVWYPQSLVPGATWNVASSLIVPVVVLIAAAGTTLRERNILQTILLGLVVLSVLFGLFQFSGSGIVNPLVNATPGEVSGNFANRNHFALFVAIGCLLVPAWTFGSGRPRWRGPVAIGLLLLFALTILASGSRSGMLVGILALAGALLLAAPKLRRELAHMPRWGRLTALAGAGMAFAIPFLVSVMTGRAVSVDRMLAGEGGEDMRLRALPTVLQMVRAYFPTGSGFGGFEPLFRRYEPFNLLKLTYFNHAHNDFLEVLIDGGVVALTLLVAAIVSLGIAGHRAWRARPGEGHEAARTGSLVMMLVLVSSGFDYPSRTPLMMAVIVLAAIWMCTTRKGGAQSPLPDQAQQL